MFSSCLQLITSGRCIEGSDRTKGSTVRGFEQSLPFQVKVDEVPTVQGKEPASNVESNLLTPATQGADSDSTYF